MNPFVILGVRPGVNVFRNEMKPHDVYRSEGKDLESVLTRLSEMVKNREDRKDFTAVTGNPEAKMRFVFRSVLEDLPEKVFQELMEIKYFAFLYTPFPGFEVKRALFEYAINGHSMKVITIPYESCFLSYAVLRAEMVLALARIYSEHIPMGTEAMVKSVPKGSGKEEGKEQKSEENWFKEAMQDTDRLPIEWGFKAEIEALREYREEMQEIRDYEQLWMDYWR